MPLDLVVLGHLTHDIIVTPSGETHIALGGTAAYTSIAATKLGARVGVVSKVGADFKKEYIESLAEAGVDLAGLIETGGKTTTFKNVYDKYGVRTQNLLGVAETIGTSDIPEKYLDAKCFHFGPLYHEVSYDVIKLAHRKRMVTSLDPQGYCRRAKPDRVVEASRWEDAEDVLPFINVFRSDEAEAEHVSGVKDPTKALGRIQGMGPEIVLITMGKRGSILRYRGATEKIPTIRERRLVDPTGAGDVYTAGFIVKYLESGNPLESALFASCTASIAVEGVGVSSLPTRKAVKERLEVQKKRLSFTEI